MFDEPTPFDDKVLEYARLLLQERRWELQMLDEIESADASSYRACRRSLEQGIDELETLLQKMGMAKRE